MAEAEKEKIQHYAVGAVWSGDEKGCGEISAGGGTVSIPIGGATDLGGCGKGANPEELLLAAGAACFVNTWVIFLKKLGLTYAEPALRVTGKLGKDPAGGFQMLAVTIHARVPASLMSERKADVLKTLQLAEKYCIISKVIKMAVPLEVVVEEV